MKTLMPLSMAELPAALAGMTDKSRIIAGGTDYVIASRSRGFEPDALLCLGGIPEMHEITLTEKELRVGAMATMSHIARSLPHTGPFAAVVDAVSDVGSPQIRNKATWVGNLCNASPAGDMLPVSWLYDAQLEIMNADGSVERMPVDRLILGPKKNSLKVGQAVTAVVIDAARWSGYFSAFHKIGSRERVSISREGAAALVKLNADGSVAQARITLGAVANTPIRVPEAEALLIGGRLEDDVLFTEVTRIMAQTIHDNCRPTNRIYKTEAARGLTADLFALLRSRA